MLLEPLVLTRSIVRHNSMQPDVAFSIFIALCLCGITLLIWLYKRKKRNVVLILGVCGSGKTTLLSKLAYDDTKSCYTSLAENRATYQTRKDKLIVIDIPGHEKLRYECLNKYKSETRGLLFVIDSQNIQVELKDVAEYLYDVLTDGDLTSRKVKMLVACNKQDSASAKGSLVIRNLLEKELNTVALTRAGALEGLDRSVRNGRKSLTSPGSAFTFSSGRVQTQFVECSATTDVESVKTWMQEV